MEFPSEETAEQRRPSVTTLSVEEQLLRAKEQIAQEKAGKRKLFHSIVKLADELGKARAAAKVLHERTQYAERTWYAGGIWRAPDLLPSVTGQFAGKQLLHKTVRLRESTSLSDLFFSLVTVTAFTRVGVTMSEQGGIAFGSFCYFTIFFTIWSKQASYSTRFDTTDLSAQITTLLISSAVLFASLSVQSPIDTSDSNRIMYVAAAVALLHGWLYFRVLLAASSYSVPNSTADLDSQLVQQVKRHAVFSIVMCVVEALIWLYGSLLQPVDWDFRWVIFVSGLLAATVRVPRAFLQNDFHASCSKRGVLFILLLGFLLQSVVVVASEFFAYQSPTLEQYVFIGAVCLLFFCIKLLYVNDDSDTLAQDHALLLNRWAAFFFHVGQFLLLLSTTVLGSGLNVLTHQYLAAAMALPGPEKSLVCGGFAAVLLSTFFIKSMHLKRIPTDPRSRALFVAAYIIQTIVLLATAGIAIAMSWGGGAGVLEYLLQTDIELVIFLSGSCLFVVVMSWLDEGVELALYETAADARAYRVHPFGFFCCCWQESEPLLTTEEVDQLNQEEFLLQQTIRTRSTSFSNVLSPLLAHAMQKDMHQGYDSTGNFSARSADI